MPTKTKRDAERAAVAAKHQACADYTTWLRAWSHGANGTQCPLDIASMPVAQHGYEQGMEARTAASVKMRAKLKVSREELGAYLAKQG